MSILKKNIFSNLIGQTALLLIGFVSFRYVYTSLGEDGLGIIYFSLMLSTMLTASLELGMAKTTVRELAGYKTTEPDYVIKLLQTFSFVYLCTYALLSITFALSVPLITGSWVNLTTMDRDLANHALMIIGTSSLLSIPKAFLSSICVGLQKMHVNNAINVVVAILQQVGIILLLSEGNDIVHVGYWIAATNMLNVLVYLFFVSRLVTFKALLPKFSMPVIARVKKYLSKMAWISVLSMATKQLDKLLISILLPIGVLGIYSFAYTTVTKLALITDSIMQAVFPVFSELDRKNDSLKSHDRFFSIQDILIYGLVPVYVALTFFALPLFTVLLDEVKARALILPLLFLSVAFYLNGLLRLFSTYVLAKGKPIYIFRSIILVLVIAVPSSVLLINEFGMAGAAFSWIVISITGACYMVPVVYLRELHKPARLWLGPAFLASITACITYLPAWFMAYSISNTEPVAFISVYIVATLIYSVVALNLSSGGLRNALLKLLPSLSFLVFVHRRPS